jgi:hypothetical protein
MHSALPGVPYTPRIARRPDHLPQALDIRARFGDVEVRVAEGDFAMAITVEIAKRG